MDHASRPACAKSGAGAPSKTSAAMLAGMLALALSLAGPVSADRGAEQDTTVQIKKSGETLIIDVSLSVPATPHESWDVLTDYDHMTQFLPNLQLSKIVESKGNTLHVSQKGKATYGLLSFSFDSIREVVLTPYSEIRSHILSGSIKQANATTQLIAEGNGTRILHHSESIPGTWIPPFIGKKIIDSQIREQYGEMRKEIIRRKTAVAQQ